MRTELETRLKQLPAPDAPPDLKARCLQTIPAGARQTAPKPRGFLRPLSAPKLGLATLVIATAIGLAFWNTRPTGNVTTPASGSVAFAQTVEAMKHVTYFRAESWSEEPEWSERPINWRSTRPRMMGVSEFDLSHGLYSETTRQLSAAELSDRERGREPELGTSWADRYLLLPDGTSYLRTATSSTLLIQSKPDEWARTEKIVGEMAGGIERPSDLRLLAIPIDDFQVQSTRFVASSSGEWKRQTVDLYVFRASPDYKFSRSNVLDIETKLYVDPKTHLVTARQVFVVFKDGTKKQLQQAEVDYTRPDASVFDPARLKIGAQIVDERRK